MSDSIRYQPYPIFLIGDVQYWKVKKKFKFYRNQFRNWAMLAIESGAFSYSVDGMEGEAGAGDVLLIPPGKAFVREIIDPLSFAFAQFIYEREDQAEEQRITHLLKELFGYKFTPTEQDRLYNNLRQLYPMLMNKSDPLSRKWTTHFFSDIWGLFYIEAERSIQQTKIVNDPLMQEAREWIDRHAFDKIQMRTLAEKLDIHPVQLSRRFQKIYGMLPSHYLFSLRMEKAKSLLVQTDYTMEHIAQLCGYDNGYYFSRMFTQYARVNPSVFRRIHSAPPL